MKAIDKLINKEGDINSDEIEELFKLGLNDEISRKDLDRLIARAGQVVYHACYFRDFYMIKAIDESGKVVKMWTIAVGIMTIVITLMTAFNTYMTYLIITK